MAREPKRGVGLLFSSLVNLAILGLIGVIGFTVLDRRDLFECRIEGRRLSDEELVRDSLAFLRGEQSDNAVEPQALPAGYDVSDPDDLFADSRFTFDVVRFGNGPRDVLKPRRSWPERQLYGERFAVRMDLPGEAPDTPALEVLHVSNNCGLVEAAWGPV